MGNKWVINVFMLVQFMHERWGVENDLNQVIFNLSFYLFAGYFTYSEYKKDKDHLYLIWAVLWLWWSVMEVIHLFHNVPTTDYFYLIILPLVFFTFKDLIINTIKHLKPKK